MNKRKTITPKIRLQVLTRDSFTCVSCGRSPVTNHGLELEVDHVQPFSKNGLDELSNFQTLCRDCNRGKGNDEKLNKLLENDIGILLKKINPQIIEDLSKSQIVKVVANQEDFSELWRKNNDTLYSIEVIPNTIIGYQAGYGLGVYTLDDNHGHKVNFIIKIK